MRSVWAFFVAALLATGGLSAAASSATGSPAARTPEHVAHITVVGTDDDLDALIEAMREPLEALGLHARGQRGGDTPADDPGDVFISVDMHVDDHVDIVVEARAAPAVHRTILRDAGRSRAVVAEDVAYAVRATLESLLASAPPDAAPVDGPAAPPPPSPAPRFGLDGAALVNGRAIATSTVAFGAALAFDAAFWGRARWRPLLWVTGAFDAPFSTTTTEVTLETTTYSLRLVPAVELVRVGPVRLAAGAGAGLDLFRVDPSVSEVTPIAIRAPSTYVDPVLEAELLVRVRLTDRLGLMLAATVDYDTGPHYYSEFDQSGVPGDVLVPWRARPAMFAGICFRMVGGASGCAAAP